MTTREVRESRFTAEETRQFYESGLWTDKPLGYFVDKNASENPDGLCVAGDGRTLTFKQARDESVALAGGLSRLGIGTGDAVVVQLPNVVEAVVVFYALARIGAICVPRMMIYRESEVFDAASRTDAKAIITAGVHRRFDHAEMALEVAGRVDTVETVVTLGSDREGTTPYAELISGTPYEGPDASPDDDFIIIFTSGTTSAPKGALHNFNTLVACARGLNNMMELTTSSRCFTPSPIMHNTGLNAGVMSPCLKGFGTVLQDQWDAEVALNLVSELKCTHTMSATPFATMMVAAFDPAVHDMSSFKVFGCGGAPVPASVVRDVNRVLGCRMTTIYGQSENGLQTITRANDPIERITSSDGKAVPSTDVLMLDLDGNVVGPGQEGEICSRGPGVMLEYWRDAERTAETFTPDGYLRSGDIGKMDDDGYVRITGRVKDMINRGGVKIAPLEIEEVLLEHPGVREVAVIGSPDPTLGERVCAFVVPVSDANVPTLDDLVTFMRTRRLAIQKLPERLEIRTELPKTVTGKIEKFRLRNEFELV